MHICIQIYLPIYGVYIYIYTYNIQYTIYIYLYIYITDPKGIQIHHSLTCTNHGTATSRVHSSFVPAKECPSWKRKKMNRWIHNQIQSGLTAALFLLWTTGAKQQFWSILIYCALWQQIQMIHGPSNTEETMEWQLLDLRSIIVHCTVVVCRSSSDLDASNITKLENNKELLTPAHTHYISMIYYIYIIYIYTIYDILFILHILYYYIYIYKLYIYI